MALCRDRRPLCALSALLLAAALGTTSGCITAFAPNIRCEDHHAAMRPASKRTACLTCHETESHMAARMKHMSGEALSHHMQEMQSVIRPPLVQDWMVRDRRGCVDCHHVKGWRGA